MKALPRTSNIALVCSLLLVAGCGGGSESQPTASASRAIPNVKALAVTSSALAIPLPELPDPMLDNLAIPANAAQVGMFSPLQPWTLNGVHVAVLPNGRVVSYGSPPNVDQSNARTMDVWDPTLGFGTGSHNWSNDPNRNELFCSTGGFLGDGQLLIAGGKNGKQSSIFKYIDQTITPNSFQLDNDRYYATLVTLGDGRKVILGGMDDNTEAYTGNPDAAEQNGISSPQAEMYVPSIGWRKLPGTYSREAFGHDFQRNNYPRAWVMPNGQIFGISSETMWWLDADANGGLGSIRIAGKFKTPPSASLPANVAGAGVGVMFEQGKILMAGGNGAFVFDGLPASNQATLVDVTSGTPQLTELPPMQFRRRFANGTVLPNGQVVVNGGTQNSNDSGANAVRDVEIFNPATRTWTLGPKAATDRLYHSSAVLMPNATVLTLGGGSPGPVYNANAEVYYPAYLFTSVNGSSQLAQRPVFSAISSLGFVHGATGQIDLKGPVNIAKLVMVPNSVETHNYNNTQRLVPLSYTQSGNRLSFTLPASGNLAPPGYYQIFAMDEAGVPSKAAIVALGDGVATPPQQPTSTGTGLQGSYFANAELSGTSVLQRTGLVNFDFGNAAPAPGLPVDNFSIRWTGEVEAIETGSYQFRTNSDDGVRVYLDGKLVIDNWGNHFPAFDTSAPVLLNAGQRVQVVIEYRDTANTALIQLSWMRPGQAWDVVPLSQLYPKAYVAPAVQGYATALNCAGVGADCAVPVGKVTTVWFGAGSAWVSKTGVTGSLACTAASFGTDPAPGLATRTCRYEVTGNVTPDTGAVACATENASCVLPARAQATVWFGAGSSWSVRTAQSGAVPCNTGTFGDPAASVVKTCVYRVTSVGDGGSISAPPVQLGRAASWAPGLEATGYTFSWNFGDGSAATAYSASSAASRSYAAPGLYTVRLTSRHSSGVSATKTFFQAVYAAPVAGAPRSSAALLVEPRVGLSNRVWVVNPDSDSVAVLDAATNASLAEIAVGKSPRTLARAGDGRIWVVNREDATLSIINPATLTVVATVALPAGSQPHGIVIAANNTAYVSLEALGEVRKLSATGAALGTAAVGNMPRHLALNPDGSLLLVSRFVTDPLPGEGTAVVNTAGGSATVSVVATSTMLVQRTVGLAHSDRPESEASASGIPNYLGAPAISPDGSTAWVPSKQDNVRRGTLRSGVALDFQTTVCAISSRINLRTWAESLDTRFDHDNASLASAATHDTTGTYLFVALETSRRVDVINARTGQPLLRFDVGLAPQGVAVSPDNRRLYVQNFMDRSVSVIDITPITRNGELRVAPLSTVSTVATERLAARVFRGKQLFYDARDPRLARDSYMSCASCHNDGGSDGRTWDFTSAGEGLRNTPSLRGRGGMAQGFAHWSANFDEIQDFEGQIRSFAGGTGLMGDAYFNFGTRNRPLGDKKAGLSADLDALAAYVSSLNTFARSPLRNANRTLTAAAQAGKQVFAAANCASCHGGTQFTGSADGSGLKNVGTVKTSSGLRLGAPLTGIDAPTLRDVWMTAPYLHDGSAPTLAAAVQAHAGNSVAGTDLNNLVAYLRQIGSEEVVAPSPTGSVGNGLLASYFASAMPVGEAQLQRLEAVNFNWASAAPDTGLPVDNFSVRWSGQVQAVEAGAYRWRILSEGGVRLSLNGRLVIDNWTRHVATADTSATLMLAAGQTMPIVLEYQDTGGAARVELSWVRPNGTTEIIPSARLYGQSYVPPSPVPTGAAVRCAAEGGTCALPAGVVASVWFGAGTTWTVRPGLSGSVACSTATFSDPAFGVGKACFYESNTP